MKRSIKKFFGYIELLRYRILAKDSVGSVVYRYVIKVLYLILSSKLLLNSRIINYRNREGSTLYDMVKREAFDNHLLYKDMVLCYFYYHIVPWEYKLYHFENKQHKERLNYLSDVDRYMCCELLMGAEVYETLKDKYKFYKMLETFYKRPIFCFSNNTLECDLNNFLKCIEGKLFVKPLDGSLGRNTFIVFTKEEKTNLFVNLKKLKGQWLIEGAISQAASMAEFNISSVNTLRVPSIRVKDKVHILQPFFRTGRNGQIVDNAGAGGILCVIDPSNGIVITDGFDESSNVYECHPDSHKKYKGWQIPYYQELMILVERIHKSLPEKYKYIGFDFALTNEGWDLIEGNWGQFVGQIAAQEGIKNKFDKYLGLLK